MAEHEFKALYRQMLSNIQLQANAIQNRDFEDTALPGAFRSALGSAGDVELLPEPPVFRPGLVGALGATLQTASGTDRSAVRRLGQKVERTARERRQVQQRNQQVKRQSEQEVRQLELGLAQAEEQFREQRSERLRSLLRDQFQLQEKLRELEEREDPEGKYQLELEEAKIQLKEAEERLKQITGAARNAKYDEAFKQYAEYVKPMQQQLFDNAPGLEGEGSDIVMTGPDGQRVAVQFMAVAGTPQERIEALINNTEVLSTALDGVILTSGPEEHQAKEDVIEQVKRGYWNYVAGIMRHRNRMDERARRQEVEGEVPVPQAASPEQAEIVREATVAQAKGLVSEVIQGIQGDRELPGAGEFAEVLEEKMITKEAIGPQDFKTRDAAEFVSKKLTSGDMRWVPGESWVEMYVPWALAMEETDGTKRVVATSKIAELAGPHGRGGWRPTRDAEAVPGPGGEILVLPDRLGAGGLKSLTVPEALSLARDAEFGQPGYVEYSTAAGFDRMLTEARAKVFGVSNELHGIQIEYLNPRTVTEAEEAASNPSRVVQ